jgi:SAM-dependent methyltransferase
MRIFPTPPYHDEPELLDSAHRFSRNELEATLRDIRRANIFGLGTWVIIHHLSRLVRNLPTSRPLRVLDVATGSGDIPEELCRWARRQGRKIELVLTDISAPILNIARQRIVKAGFADRMSFVVCDATHMPFADGSFDVALCSLTFHHLKPEQARQVLRQMARVARIGFIVNDIYRSRGAWYTARFLTHATFASSLTCHDGPASVLRAYTPVELARLAASAGLNARIYRHPFWRAALVVTTTNTTLDRNQNGPETDVQS